MTVSESGLAVATFNQGDGYLLMNPRLVRQLLHGQSQEEANHFYYDVRR